MILRSHNGLETRLILMYYCTCPLSKLKKNEKNSRGKRKLILRHSDQIRRMCIVFKLIQQSTLKFLYEYRLMHINYMHENKLDSGIESDYAHKISNF